MNLDKLRNVTAGYQRHLSDEGFHSVMDNSAQPYKMLDHCAWMLQEMDHWLQARPEGEHGRGPYIDPDQGTIEKAMRWLGFVQGIFCAQGVFTIDEMRDHNRTGLVGSKGPGNPFAYQPDGPATGCLVCGHDPNCKTPNR